MGITDKEKELGDWIIKECGITDFNKHNMVWDVAIKTICMQQCILRDYDTVEYRNVMDHIHNTINYKKGGHNG